MRHRADRDCIGVAADVGGDRRNTVMAINEQSHAFVVKIWHERRDIAGAKPVWRGSVDDVQSGSRLYFDSLGVLCSYLTRHAGLAADRMESDEEPRAPLPH
jgi:hypothetical protein